MLTLAISCLTTSNLPWFMDLTLQVPIQYCSLQHQTLTSHIHNWVLFLHWLSLFVFSWAISPFFCSSIFSTYQVGEFIFQCHNSLPFHTVHGVLKARILTCGLPFPSSVNHVLSELSTMTHPSWVVLHGMAHSFIELDKAVVHVISLVSFLWLCSVKDKRLMEASWWERLTEGETGFCSDGQGHDQ